MTGWESSYGPVRIAPSILCIALYLGVTGSTAIVLSFVIHTREIIGCIWIFQGLIVWASVINVLLVRRGEKQFSARSFLENWITYVVPRGLIFGLIISIPISWIFSIPHINIVLATVWMLLAVLGDKTPEELQGRAIPWNATRVSFVAWNLLASLWLIIPLGFIMSWFFSWPGYLGVIICLWICVPNSRQLERNSCIELSWWGVLIAGSFGALGGAIVLASHALISGYHGVLPILSGAMIGTSIALMVFAGPNRLIVSIRQYTAIAMVGTTLFFLWYSIVFFLGKTFLTYLGISSPIFGTFIVAGGVIAATLGVSWSWDLLHGTLSRKTFLLPLFTILAIPISMFSQNNRLIRYWERLQDAANLHRSEEHMADRQTTD